MTVNLFFVSLKSEGIVLSTLKMTFISKQMKKMINSERSFRKKIQEIYYHFIK